MVRHGAAPVTYKVVGAGDDLLVCVDDANLEPPPSPARPNGTATRGRGLFLIRSFMDEFQMRHLEVGGTEVTLVKYTVSK